MSLRKPFTVVHSSSDLLAMSDEALERVDPLEIDLAVARTIPGCESLDVARYKKVVDEWAERVRSETDRHLSGASRLVAGFAAVLRRNGTRGAQKRHGPRVLWGGRGRGPCIWGQMVVCLHHDRSPGACQGGCACVFGSLGSKAQADCPSSPAGSWGEAGCCVVGRRVMGYRIRSSRVRPGAALSAALRCP
jgi:hypothetical protein